MIIFREKSFKKTLFHLCLFVHRIFFSVFMVYFDCIFSAESNGGLIFSLGLIVQKLEAFSEEEKIR
jgi:hypothetical protein